MDQFGKWKEMVISTIKDENKLFEIRKDKKDIFKIYSIENGIEVFWGAHNSFEDIIKSEPNKTAFMLSGERSLMVEKEFEGTLYRIYYSEKDKEYLRVYKVIDETEKFIEQLPIANLKYSLLYLNLSLRK